ncbi:pyridoxamine 5'-phosphate oxidase family protein [Actinosynnema sp. NPDC050436]|uniref:pyridoxamine 5'-phosphate oxidase family protein n=1 Tax=Actinosynnema sp. NPDC050436 TaxID=3155659 RepID=UPI0033E05121
MGDDVADVVERAADLLLSSRFLVLGTASGDPAGDPWVAAVNHVVADDGRLLFCSSPAARHSGHVAAHPVVAVTAYRVGPAPGDVDGFQARGRCAVVPPDELAARHHEFFLKDFPDPAVRAQVLIDPARFAEGGTHRLYAVRLDECWVRDPHSWGRDQTDRRLPVPVPDLVRRLGERARSAYTA